MIGSILGDRYEILEQIGEGGMSYVYKARCRKLNRFVAVKVLKNSFKDNENIVNKFKKEATSIANLSNPNIVNVLDVGSTDGVNYIVMEYVEGKTLKDIIKEKKKIPYDIAITFAIKIARALDCAHKNNIIHRDIKPQNILVTRDGVVKVTDFGIAKSMSESTISHTNSVLGSAHYFSPEQAKGSYVDYRTDLYSLGIVLYEMVTGEVPFDGDSPVTVAVKHIQENPIEPKVLTSEIPDNLNNLIMKAISKDPSSRYQTALEFIDALERIKNNEDFTMMMDKVEIDDSGFTRVMDPIVDDDLVKENSNNSNIQSEKNSNDNNGIDKDLKKVSQIHESKPIKDPKPIKKVQNKGNKTIIAGVIIIAIAIVGAGAFVGINMAKGSSNATSSSSTAQVTVPDLVNQTNAKAKAQLTKLNLVYEEKTVESSEAEGTVLSTNPVAGTKVAQGSTIIVTVSGGQTTINLPNLVGLSLETAKSTITSNGLKVGTITYEYSNTVASGNVISSSPISGSGVPSGYSINLVVSKGANSSTITVPDLTGKTVEESKTILKNLGLNVNAVKGENAPTSSQNGLIYSQDPASSYQVKSGSTVNVTYYGDCADNSNNNSNNNADSNNNSNNNNSNNNNSNNNSNSNNNNSNNNNSNNNNSNNNSNSSNNDNNKQDNNSGDNSNSSKPNDNSSNSTAGNTDNSSNAISTSPLIGMTGQQAISWVASHGGSIRFDQKGTADMNSWKVVSVSSGTMTKGGSITATLQAP